MQNVYCRVFHCVRELRLLVFYVTCNDISVIYVYVTSQMYSGLNKKLFLRSGSQRHRYFAGFLTCPSYTDTGPSFLYGDSNTPPNLVAFYDTLVIRGSILDLNPRPPNGGIVFAMRNESTMVNSRTIQILYCFTLHCMIRLFIWFDCSVVRLTYIDIYTDIPPWGPGGLSRKCVLRIPMRVVNGD